MQQHESTRFGELGCEQGRVSELGRVGDRRLERLGQRDRSLDGFCRRDGLRLEQFLRYKVDVFIRFRDD
jgi:hypothetical protein